MAKIEGTQNIETIGAQAFYYCSKLTSFDFGNKLVSVGEQAFRCTAIGSVRLASSVTTVEQYAFANNDALKSVTIGSGLQTIGDFAFYACTALTDVACDSKIGTGMFWNDAALKNVTVGAGVTTIGSCAFYGCTGLQNAVFERSVGWSAEKTEEDGTTQSATPAVSSDGAANAALLNETYAEYVWTKL